MKPKNIYQGLALLAMALTTAACQNQLNDTAPQPQPGEKVNMTIRATQGTTPQTRTEYEDNQGEDLTGNVVVKWDGTAAENIYVFGYATNTNKLTTSAELTSLPATISEDGKNITFEGKVTAAENHVAIYPVNNCKLDNGRLFFNFMGQKQDCTPGKELAHLKDYDVMLGTPVEGDPNNYTFEHKAIMLRFDLNLPAGQTEVINKVTLSTNYDTGVNTELSGWLEDNKLVFSNTSSAKSISLDITNHAKNNQLKAYMMIPYIEVYKATLIITVATNSGNTYEGILTSSDNTPLKAGKCYILAPTLKLLTNATTPSLPGGTEI